MNEKKLTIIVISIWLISMVFFFNWFEKLSPEEQEEFRELNQPLNMTITEAREKCPRLFNFVIIMCVVSLLTAFFLTGRFHV